jgi:hypothetical protein
MSTKRLLHDESILPLDEVERQVYSDASFCRGFQKAESAQEYVNACKSAGEE